jgi:hypothetical protein
MFCREEGGRESRGAHLRFVNRERLYWGRNSLATGHNTGILLLSCFPFLVPPGLLTANPAACDHPSLPVLGDPVVLIGC